MEHSFNSLPPFSLLKNSPGRTTTLGTHRLLPPSPGTGLGSTRAVKHLSVQSPSVSLRGSLNAAWKSRSSPDPLISPSWQVVSSSSNLLHLPHLQSELEGPASYFPGIDHLQKPDVTLQARSSPRPPVTINPRTFHGPLRCGRLLTCQQVPSAGPLLKDKNQPPPPAPVYASLFNPVQCLTLGEPRVHVDPLPPFFLKLPPQTFSHS